MKRILVVVLAILVFLGGMASATIEDAQRNLNTLMSESNARINGISIDQTQSNLASLTGTEQTKIDAISAIESINRNLCMLTSYSSSFIYSIVGDAPYHPELVNMVLNK